MVAGCQDSCVPALEQRVKQLEERTQQIEAERTKSAADEDARRLKFENSVTEANADFQKNLENNGTKARKGSYNVPVPLLEQSALFKLGLKSADCSIPSESDDCVLGVPRQRVSSRGYDTARHWRFVDANGWVLEFRCLATRPHPRECGARFLEARP
jgi:hypothetical protein